MGLNHDCLNAKYNAGNFKVPVSRSFVPRAPKKHGYAPNVSGQRKLDVLPIDRFTIQTMLYVYVLQESRKHITTFS